jgi:hypothetical protein
MIEDTLTYTTSRSEISPRDTVAALDEDARLFLVRMTTDIATVAFSADRQAQRGRLEHALLAALSAPETTRTGAWKKLYSTIFAFITVCDAAAPPATLPPETLASRGRLRRFIAENADLANADPSPRTAGQSTRYVTA